MDPSLRRSLYMLMLVAAAGIMVARVVNVELVQEPSLYKANPTRKWPEKAPSPWPTFSSNDRVRWATVKAWAEGGKFAIGQRIADETNPKGYRDEGITFTDGFGSVDKILLPADQQFYSTKPPLLTMLAALEYRLLRKVFRWSIDVERWEVVVTILMTLNVVPLLLSLWLMSRLIEQCGRTDWGRLFTFACACFGTFLPTFANTLNNHVPAACCVAFAMYSLLARPGEPGASATGDLATPLADAPRSPVRLMLVGLFTGIAACMDLPAAALAGGIALLVVLQSRKGLLWLIAAFLIPIAAQTLINYQAVGTWEPVYSKFGGPEYEYEGSHWAKRHDPTAKGIDFINEPKHVYARNLLVGHHGLFALTPIFLIAFAGACFKPVAARRFHLLIPLIAIVVIVFYIFKTNNYGGWSSGPRWLFWLTPLFLLAMLPAADRLATTRLGRGFAYICLGASAFSATYPWANPWRHPWIYQWCEYMDWIHY